MWKYIFKRFIRSIFSIVMVTTLVFVGVYALVPRSSIFKNDPTYTKLKSQPDKLQDYENTAFAKMGYHIYLNQKQFQSEVQKDYPEFTNTKDEANAKIVKEWTSKNKDWKVGQLPVSGAYYATEDINLLVRVFNFYKDLVQVDHPWVIKDPDNPNLERGYKITHDETAGWALTASGTKHYYQIYFNNKFPFIHQNIFKLNLGVAYPTFAGQPVVDVVTDLQGRPQTQEITLPDGKVFKSSIDPFTRYYKPKSEISPMEKRMFDNNYAGAKNVNSEPSMMGTSFRLGIAGVFISYLISIPMAALMARYKGQLFDKFGTVMVMILISVPTVAFVFFIRFIGSSWFNLPDLFPTLGAGDFKSYILPAVILGLLGVGNSVIWIRRYMVDQQSSDYVKFARAKGLTEQEISRNHIMKNALIPIVNGIPGAIIFSIAGATITETIFAVPGMGKMLPDAILSHNNPIAVGLIFIFAVLGVFSVFLGDITMTLVDPRIRLDVKEDK